MNFRNKADDESNSGSQQQQRDVGDDGSSISSSASSRSSYSDEASSSESLSDRLAANAVEQGYANGNAVIDNNNNINNYVRRRTAPVSTGGRSYASESDHDDASNKGRYRHHNGDASSINGHPNCHHHRHHNHNGNHHASHRSSSGSPRRGRRRKSRQQSTTTTLRLWLLPFCRVVSRKFRHFPHFFLAFCFLFWLMVQTMNVYESISDSTHGEGLVVVGNDNYNTNNNSNNGVRYFNNKKRGTGGSVGQRTARARNRSQPPPEQQQQQGGGLSAAGAFLTDAVLGFVDLVQYPAKIFHKVSRGEGLAPGCVRDEWQELNLPNCNDMHETDLYQVFARRVRDDGGYVGSGYWRDVWLVDPRFETSHSQAANGDQEQEHVQKYGAVLKMMKAEHKVEMRNFERHRRDGLAMERLTSSPNIVDIYAYCGNSVLTEYVGNDLHQVLYHADDEDQSPGGISTPKIALPSTGKEKLQMALEVIKGVAALHQVTGGPIVHADIADKQFLIDERGHVKLNDFNRCR